MINFPHIWGSGGTPSQYVDMFGSAWISTMTGIKVLSSGSENNVGHLSFEESQAGYEGFNIVIPGLTIGSSYTAHFDFQYTDATFQGESYTSGVDVWPVDYSNYSYYDSWPDNIDRDLNTHSHSITFTADAATMYLSFNVSALSDNRSNYFEITNLYVEAV